jgi:cell wall-associated NlpC family hydrolase
MKKITTLAAILGGLAISSPGLAENPPVTAAVDASVAQPAAGGGYIDNVRDVIFYALSMVGINYRWGGNSPQTGFDCSGLVSHVFRQIYGLVLPRDSYGMARLGKPIEVDELRPGDLVFFNTLRRPFSHVGIYLGDKRFIHAPSAGKSVQIVNMNESYWSTRYNGARRIEF